MEGWKENVEKKLQTEVKWLATPTTSQQEEYQMLLRLLEEAATEESLTEVDMKRMADEQAVQDRWCSQPGCCDSWDDGQGRELHHERPHPGDSLQHLVAAGLPEGRLGLGGCDG